AAGIDLDDLAPPQLMMIQSLARMYFHQALDLMDDPGRAPGWQYTQPEILDGWGRGSMMVPQLIAAAHPDLGSVTSFLDVGTGVGSRRGAPHGPRRRCAADPRASGRPPRGSGLRKRARGRAARAGAHAARPRPARRDVSRGQRPGAGGFRGP